MTERELFLSAMEIEDPAERAAYLDGACGGDADLIARVEALLASHESRSRFLNTPVMEQVSDATLADDATQLGDSTREAASIQNNGPDTLIEDCDDMSDEIPLGYLEPSSREGTLGRLAHYEIEEVLGRGAFGTVLKAFDEKLHRVVAIKVLSPQMAATSPARKRFLREARASARIRHEHVVAIYGVEEEPIPYLVMEYIPGQTLQQRLDAHGPLDVNTVLRLGKQMADGLAAAHAEGLIHRDIKPGNILLDTSVADRVKITDFGLARTADDASMTQSGMIAGTPMYMAPEQAHGKKLDQRADLFSFGSVLYQMLSGRPPFRAPSTMAVLKRVTEDAPRPIQEVIPEVPDWMCEIVRHLHAKDPDERYASAKEVSELLARCLADVEAGRKPKIPTPAQLAGESSESARSPEPGRVLQRPLTRVAAALLVLLVVLGITEATDVTQFTSTVFRIATGEGTLIVEVDDPTLTVTVDRNGEELTVSDGTHHIFTLRPGEREVVVSRDGEMLSHQLVTITRNERTVVRMSLESDRVVGGSTDTRPAPVADFALTFDSRDDRVDLPTFVNQLGDDPFTIEAWVTIGPGELPEDQRITVFRDKSGIYAHLQLHKTWRFWRTTEETGPGYLSDQSPVPGLPTHLAAVWDGSQCILFVNGRRQSVSSAHVDSLVFDGTTPSWIGGVGRPESLETFVPYTIDELRVSDTARYAGDFTPAMRYELDEQTLALYHFDEGAGDVLVDASGNDHDGKITGARWVRRDTSPIDQPYEWPADAPPPAIAPFDAEQAAQHQQAWADYLGLPVEKDLILSGGAKLTMVFIPPGEFLMGSRDDERSRVFNEAREQGDWWAMHRIPSESPQHRVQVTRPFYLGKYEVTQNQWRAVMERGLSASLDDPDHPIANLNWLQIQPFIARLNDDNMDDNLQFQLPTEAQWEYACRAGTTSSWYHGESREELLEHAWFEWNSNDQAHPVGQRNPNPFELFDMHGNIMEWCADWYDPVSYSSSPELDPIGPLHGTHRVLRGGSFVHQERRSRAANRDGMPPNAGYRDFGFRLAALVTDHFLADRFQSVADSNPKESSQHQWPADAPPPAIAPFDADQAAQHQQAWADYLGVPVERDIVIGHDADSEDVKFTMALIPPGEFIMGASDEERATFLELAESANDHIAAVHIPGEGPQHPVRITRPFYLGRHEVTQLQWQSLMHSDPSDFSGNPGHPVEHVSRNEIDSFLAKLNQRGSDSAIQFVLPTEAQWEYACRAGTTTPWCSGDGGEELEQFGWFIKNSFGTGPRTHPVQQLQCNGFGLYDMHGNVWEWCADWYSADYYATSPMDDPGGLSSGTIGVLRGGSWGRGSWSCRSARRTSRAPDVRLGGFRVAVVLPDEMLRERFATITGDDSAGDGEIITNNADATSSVSESAVLESAEVE